MGGGVPRKALQPPGRIQQLFDLRVAVVELLQLRLGLHRFVDGHLEVVGHHLGDAVGLGKAHAQGPAHVAHHALGLHGAEGGDLRHAVLAVGIDHVLDDFHAAAFAEVHINIGQAHAFGIEEALEQQVVGDGVEVGDAQRPGHEAARRRTAARPHGDAVVLGPVDEFLYDKEIAREAHVADDVQLVAQALAVGVRIEGGRVGVFLQALFQALLGQPPEFRFQRGPFGQGVDREIMVAEIQLHIALFGDAHGIGQRFRHMAEGGFHLLGALVIKFRGLEAHVPGIVQRGLRLDAEQHLVGFHVVGIEVVAVVGGHQRQVELFGDLHEAVVDRHLFLQAVGLQLQIEAAGVDVRVFPGQRAGLVHVAGLDGARHFARDAGRKADEPLGILAQQRLVHARLVMEALQKALGHQLDEVVIARLVLGQQDEMVAPAGQLGRLVEMVMADVDLAAEDGLDADLGALLGEVGRAEHVAVIGDGTGGHAEILGAVAQVLEADGPVQQAVFGMAVQMHEIGHAAFLGRIFPAAGDEGERRRGYAVGKEISMPRPAAQGAGKAVRPSKKTLQNYLTSFIVAKASP